MSELKKIDKKDIKEAVKVSFGGAYKNPGSEDTFIAYHLREADLLIAQDMLNTICDSGCCIDEQKHMIDLVIGFIQRIGCLERDLDLKRVSINVLTEEYSKLDIMMDNAKEREEARS